MIVWSGKFFLNGRDVTIFLDFTKESKIKALKDSGNLWNIFAVVSFRVVRSFES